MPLSVLGSNYPIRNSNSKPPITTTAMGTTWFTHLHSALIARKHCLWERLRAEQYFVQMPIEKMPGFASFLFETHLTKLSRNSTALPLCPSWLKSAEGSDRGAGWGQVEGTVRSAFPSSEVTSIMTLNSPIFWPYSYAKGISNHHETSTSHCKIAFLGLDLHWIFSQLSFSPWLSSAELPKHIPRCAPTVGAVVICLRDQAFAHKHFEETDTTS